MKNRTNLLIIIGGALAVFALVLGSLRAATSTATTVIAARPIAAGTRLTAADVSEQPINTHARVTGALGCPRQRPLHRIVRRGVELRPRPMDGDRLRSHRCCLALDQSAVCTRL